MKVYDAELRALSQVLVETFDDPEIRYVTFERTAEGWNMRRFTRIPDNAASPFAPPHSPE